MLLYGSEYAGTVCPYGDISINAQEISSRYLHAQYTHKDNVSVLWLPMSGRTKDEERKGILGKGLGLD